MNPSTAHTYPPNASLDPSMQAWLEARFKSINETAAAASAQVQEMEATLNEHRANEALYKAEIERLRRDLEAAKYVTQLPNAMV
jgi:chromosome segregation ATPase